VFREEPQILPQRGQFASTEKTNRFVMQTERNTKYGPNAGVRNVRTAGKCI